jgi:crotonobetainyl-CoA:carnitine CoA-transferase CaiB-like acyl-CoA transferase
MLKGLKVVELASVLAGPSVGMFFAELGAEVIKVEHPEHPDVTRTWKLPNEKATNNVSAYFSSINYKKRYLSLDLKQEKDRQKVLKLIQSADILLMNFKKGDDVKMGLTSKELHALNPTLIIAKISGFGNESDRVAYDLILQAETGFMSMNGTPESGPVKMPVALIDVLAAHHLKEGILLALLERYKTKKGKTVSVSLYDAAVASLVNQASNYLMNRHIPQRIGSLHPNIAPYGEIFETKDKQYITFAVGSQVHFEKLMHILKLDELIKRFKTNQDRVKNRIEIAQLMQVALTKWKSTDLLPILHENYIPSGIIKNLKAVFQEKAAQDLVREEIIDGIKTLRVSSIAFKYEN